MSGRIGGSGVSRLQPDGTEDRPAITLPVHSWRYGFGADTKTRTTSIIFAVFRRFLQPILMYFFLQNRNEVAAPVPQPTIPSRIGRRHRVVQYPYGHMCGDQRIQVSRVEIPAMRVAYLVHVPLVLCFGRTSCHDRSTRISESTSRSFAPHSFGLRHHSEPIDKAVPLPQARRCIRSPTHVLSTRAESLSAWSGAYMSTKAE